MILTQILRHSFNAVLKLIFFLSKNILLSPLLNLDLSQRVGLLLLQTTVFDFPVNTSRVYVGRPPLLPQQEARVHWRRGPSSGGHRQTACVYPLYLGCRCECLLDIRPEDSHAVCLRAGHQPAEGKLGQGCASILGFTANRGVHPLCLKREKHFSLLDSGEVLNNLCFGTETESLLFVHPASRWGGWVRGSLRRGSGLAGGRPGRCGRQQMPWGVGHSAPGGQGCFPDTCTCGAV